MDAEDKARTLTNKDKVLAFLRERRSATNHQLRRVGGSRAMARVNELQHEGHPITVRKVSNADWEVRYDLKPLGRDASTRVTQRSLFEMHQR